MWKHSGQESFKEYWVLLWRFYLGFHLLDQPQVWSNIALAEHPEQHYQESYSHFSAGRWHEQDLYKGTREGHPLVTQFCTIMFYNQYLLHRTKWNKATRFKENLSSPSASCCCSATESCPSLCDSMDCSTSGLLYPSLSLGVCSKHSCPLSQWC